MAAGPGMMERILKGAEDRIEEYRALERARQAEIQAHRAALWAAERQRLVFEASR